jgi:uncharacterized protein YbjT (DUF2867 family)
VLVVGGTGTVGREVARGLAGAGEKVAVLTRSADKAGTLPAGVGARVGDLTDPYSVGAAFDGVTKVFLLVSVSNTETQEGLTAVEWAKRSGVGKIVYMSVQGLHDAPHIPHFGAKIPIEDAVRQSGIDYTILQPNNFFQNDYWIKDVILTYGLYAHPFGNRGVSRVDVRDIADAAVNSLTTGAGRNGTYVAAGPDGLTGDGTAATYSQCVGKPVKYVGDDLGPWEQQARQMLPGWMAFDFKMMYEWFITRGFTATPDEVRAFEGLVGHPLRRFEDFARQTAKTWLNA